MCAARVHLLRRRGPHPRRGGAHLYLRPHGGADGHQHLRFGFYGGVQRVGMERWATTNVSGCVRTAYGEMDKWIKRDLERNADGLMGTIEHLEGWENWTEKTMPCLAVDNLDVDRAPRPLLTSSRLMGCTATTRAGKSSGGEVRPFLWGLGGGC